jgi:hypothetical protein
MFDELLTTTSSKSPAASEHVTDMQSRASAAADSIALYNEAMEAQANNTRRAEEYEVGDHVLLSTRFFKPPADVARGRKLAPKYAGPYEIVKKVSPVAYELHLPPGTNAYPVFHASLLRPYNADSTGERGKAIPEPVCVEGQVEYVVEKVLQSRQRRG